jgi:hypothetical protein
MSEMETPVAACEISIAVIGVPMEESGSDRRGILRRDRRKLVFGCPLPGFRKTGV